MSKKQGTFLAALQRKGNVMKAVMLRDMRTRFFNHGLGFLLVIIWPLAHLFLIISVYTVFGRRAPFGGDLYVFFGSGLVPTLSFMYVSRQMVMSILANRPMLSFPAIKPTDILFGRALLETLGSFMMAAAVLTIFALMGTQVVPHDLGNAVAALCATIYLAISVGFLVSLVAVVFPPVATIYMLFVLVIYLSSGTLFVASYMPEQIMRYLAWNPVLHGVEWMRSAYFLGYPSQVLDKFYMLSFASVAMLAGLVIERLTRGLFR
jgi:capsular polysaccharide transport system permease protein